VSDALSTSAIVYIAYPFVWLARALASLNIDFVEISVSCSGSQAPLRLLFNVIVIGIIVVIVESDLQVFWTCALSNANTKAMRLLINRYYMSNHPNKAIVQFFKAAFLSILPPPRKVIQYSIGLLTLSSFFTNNGFTETTANCNLASSLPMDTILGYISTLLTMSMAFPTIYLFAQILVPCFEYQVSHRTKKEWDDIFAGKQSPNHLTPAKVDKQKKDGNLHDETYDFTFDNISNIDNSSSDEENMIKKEEKSVDFDDLDYDIDIQNLSILSRLSFYCTKKLQKRWKKWKKQFFRIYGKLASYIAVDWFYLRFIYSFAHSMFNSQRHFLMQSVVVKESSSTLETMKTMFSSTKSVREDTVVDDAVNADKPSTSIKIDENYSNNESKSSKMKSSKLEDIRLLHIQKEASYSVAFELNWMISPKDYYHLPTYETDDLMTSEQQQQQQHDENNEIKKRKLSWSHIKKFPTYLEMVHLVELDLRKRFSLQTVKPFFALKDYQEIRSYCSYYFFSLICYSAKWFFPCQYFGSRYGNQIWNRVLKNYCLFLLVSIGNWSDLSLKEFDIERRFETFQRLLSKVERRSLRIETLSGFSAIMDDENEIAFQSSSDRSNSDTTSPHLSQAEQQQHIGLSTANKTISEYILQRQESEGIGDEKYFQRIRPI
jgi:hypothetical protein